VAISTLVGFMLVLLLLSKDHLELELGQENLKIGSQRLHEKDQDLKVILKQHKQGMLTNVQKM
jgi:hypothetical protein